MPFLRCIRTASCSRFHGYSVAHFEMFDIGTDYDISRLYIIRHLLEVINITFGNDTRRLMPKDLVA